jgi:hypothetical protein
MNEILGVLKILIIVVEQGHKYYETEQGIDAISLIRTELLKVYSDIASAHFNSAQESFYAARHSSAPNQQIRHGISHLQDAYYIYEKLLSAKKTKKVMFIFTEEVDAVDILNRENIFAGMSNIATTIAINYADLNEDENASRWKNLAVKHLENSIHAISIRLEETRYQELRNIPNKYYVEEIEVLVDSPPPRVRSIRCIEYKLTTWGQDFLTQREKMKRKCLTDVFDRKGIK